MGTRYFAREIYTKLSPTGTFAVVASVAGLFPLTQLSDYGASKVALVAFMESLRSELKREGKQIRTCTMCPFLIDTKMFGGIKIKFPASLLSQPLKKEYVAERLIQGIEYGESLILLPKLMNVLPLVWIFPEWLRDLLRNLMDEPSYMDSFSPPQSKLKVRQAIAENSKKI
jgi:all-trans-retinol dehydrogenase (NAD+)